MDDLEFALPMLTGQPWPNTVKYITVIFKGKTAVLTNQFTFRGEATPVTMDEMNGSQTLDAILAADTLREFLVTLGYEVEKL